MPASHGPTTSSGERPDRLNAQKPVHQAIEPPETGAPAGGFRDGFLFSPWSNWRGWIVIVSGVLIGQVIGFSPQLFVLIAALCLVCGWLFDR
jgi:hypothetical protein